MITKWLTDRISSKYPDRLRGNAHEVTGILNSLGVNSLSDFGQFYTKFKGRFPSSPGKLELLDLIGSGIPTIPDQTEYIQDRYEIPANYIPLTSDEGEGMYLYEKFTGEVYNYYLRDHDQFTSGKCNPEWASFQAFLEWYFNTAQASR